MASAALGLEPSVGGCIGLSALGGALEVLSTMVLAYPEHKARSGQPFGKCCTRFAVVVNLLLMGVASVAYIVGSWFGPVSLSVPVVMASKLLFNLLIVGVVLKMENFNKNQRVGTYVIAFAIFALPEVGPKPIPTQKAMVLMVRPLSIIWSAVMCGTMLLTIIAMIVLKCIKSKYGKEATDRPTLMLAVLVTAQVTSAVIGTSVGKIFADAEGSMVGICLGLFVVTAVVNVGSLMMAASSVNQGIFVPLQTCATLGVNMVTGLLIWEDATVIDQWVAYISLYWLMGLGIYMLTNGDVLEMYKRRKQLKIAKNILSMKDIANVSRATAVDDGEEDTEPADSVEGGSRIGDGDGVDGQAAAPSGERRKGSVVWAGMLRADDAKRDFRTATGSSKWKAIGRSEMLARKFNSGKGSAVAADGGASPPTNTNGTAATATANGSAVVHLPPELVELQSFV